MENPIHLYTSDDGHVRLQVALEQETVWLSLDQMTLLFERDKSVISRHIRKIFEEGELERAAVVAKNATTAADGKTYQVDYYNLDVIISVGYRVKSRRGVQFRQWATQTLRQHLVQGYTLHEKRLQERGIEIVQALALLQQTLANQSLVNAEGAAVLAVVQNYAKSWSLLQGYDEQNLVAVTARQHDMRPLAFEDVLAALAELKTALIAKGEATELFGQPRGAPALFRHQEPSACRRQQAQRRLPFPLVPAPERAPCSASRWSSSSPTTPWSPSPCLSPKACPRKRTSLSALSNTSSRYARDKSCFRTQKNRRRFLGRFFYGICY